MPAIYEDLTVFGKIVRHIKAGMVAVVVLILAIPAVIVISIYQVGRRVWRHFTPKNPNALPNT